MSYDIGSLQREHEILISGLNNEQRTIYNSITEADSSESGGMFCVYGHGGTGKTYLYRTILAAVISKGKIFLLLLLQVLLLYYFLVDRQHIHDSTSRLMTMMSQLVK